uniref:EF-hand domain-containing protein n=2 Tax=Phaeocystis antarctica TaxID=33657 RepID=A0A7S0DZW5_9EUKA|mmetsp:Transcript_13287/g.31426  ORF Transcript_13287/g.31426 Transcript_13287/m.31426 type:complete len:341 (+) Transcript_13287:589-1611(+)
MLNIVLSVLVLYLQSLSHLSDSVTLHSIELGCTIVFSCEVLVRVAAAYHPAALLFDLMVWVDIASVVPFYIELGIAVVSGVPVGAALFGEEMRSSTDLQVQQQGVETGGEVTNVLQLLRLLRLLRLLKLGRHYEGSMVLISALKRSATALLVPCFFLCVMICLFAGLMFYLEGPTGGGQAGFDNMFKASWFVLVTLTTVGYGDCYPITVGGKLVASVAIMCGVLFMAMPITIVGQSFAQVWEEREALQVVIRVQELLVERGLETHEVVLVFKEFDSSGDGQLDSEEFKRALGVLGVRLPPSKVRQLFRTFDQDHSGTVSYEEFCHIVCPDLDEETAHTMW